MIQSGPQCQTMHCEILRGAEIDAHRVASQATHLSLDQEFYGLDRKSREMHLSLDILIAVALRVRPPRSPTRPEQHDGTLRNLSVALLPFPNTHGGKLIVRVLCALGTHIQ